MLRAIIGASLGIWISLIGNVGAEPQGGASSAPVIVAPSPEIVPSAASAPITPTPKIASTPVLITPDPIAGKEKSEACVACHGVDGNSTVPLWPKIAGQPEKYFVEQLKEFRKGDKGTRNNAVMFGIVQNLTDQDIADLAAYFASQKATLGKTPEQYVSLGEKIYRGGNLERGVPACAACHDPNGSGNALAAFPPLSGQNAAYIADQLQQFKKGTRSNGPNGIMNDISKRMTDEEIQAVSNYVSGLH